MYSSNEFHVACSGPCANYKVSLPPTTLWHPILSKTFPKTSIKTFLGKVNV